MRPTQLNIGKQVHGKEFEGGPFFLSRSQNRTPASVVIEVMGHREVYDLYCILDFNNVRKRMSVILRKDGVLKLYCKGADSVIFERLDDSCAELKFKTLEHLNNVSKRLGDR
ncbi:UNVERIFIED_CONTAM: Phospholipid-transporting ATPase ID [Trichonephila clavipes]